MKKKTLLYLDSDLVEKAEEENIDISKLAEEAIKEALKVTIPKNSPRLPSNDTCRSWT